MKKLETINPDEAFSNFVKAWKGFIPCFPEIKRMYPALSFLDVLVHGFLLSHASWEKTEVDQDGFSKFSYTEISNALGITRCPAFNSVKKLSSLGIVSVKSKPMASSYLKFSDIFDEESGGLKELDGDDALIRYRSHLKKYIPCFPRALHKMGLAASEVLVHGAVLNHGRWSNVEKIDNYFHAPYDYIAEISGTYKKYIVYKSLVKMKSLKILHQERSGNLSLIAFVPAIGPGPDVHGRRSIVSSVAHKEQSCYSQTTIDVVSKEQNCSSQTTATVVPQEQKYSSQTTVAVVPQEQFRSPSRTVPSSGKNSSNFSSLLCIIKPFTNVKPTHFPLLENPSKKKFRLLANARSGRERKRPGIDGISVRKLGLRNIPPKKVFLSNILKESGNIENMGFSKKGLFIETGVRKFVIYSAPRFADVCSDRVVVNADELTESKRLGMFVVRESESDMSSVAEMDHSEKRTESASIKFFEESLGKDQGDDLRTTEGQPGASESMPNTLSKEYQTRGFKKKGKRKGMFGRSNQLEKSKSKPKKLEKECQKYYSYFADVCLKAGYNVPATIPFQDLKFTKSLVEKYSFSEVQTLIDFLVSSWEQLRQADSNLLPDPNWNQVVVSWRYEPWMEMARGCQQGEVQEQKKMLAEEKNSGWI